MKNEQGEEAERSQEIKKNMLWFDIEKPRI